MAGRSGVRHGQRAGVALKADRQGWSRIVERPQAVPGHADDATVCSVHGRSCWSSEFRFVMDSLSIGTRARDGAETLPYANTVVFEGASRLAERGVRELCGTARQEAWANERAAGERETGSRRRSSVPAGATDLVYPYGRPWWASDD